MPNELRRCPCDMGDRFGYEGDGQEVQVEHIKAYVCKPPASTDKAVIVIHDIFGWQLPNTRYMADTLTTSGYIAICPDFFVGRETWKPSDHWSKFDDWLKTQDTRKINKMSGNWISHCLLLSDTAFFCCCFCLFVCLRLDAANLPVKLNSDDIPTFLNPTFFIFAEKDDFFPLHQVSEATETNCEVNYEVKTYPGQTHRSVHHRREDSNPQDKPYIEEGRKDVIN
uniref:Carboxymethylenebutenolidase homolog n=1 Tax=Falco tinnunculus TaxID=100819 RepID=A0A8C4UDZ2_FALTI